ncbi:hypothetical protein, partial [Paenibacillus sp. P46E]|uniref:hypothetical protein n=1 Tax=Paenibacillus sp. P46E TaxID=1349436 RepID=UPI000B33B01C
MINKTTFLLIFLMVFVIFVACDNQNTSPSKIISATPLDISKYVKIEKVDKDMYKIFLKDEKKNIIFEEEYPVEPMINVIYENII